MHFDAHVIITSALLFYTVNIGMHREPDNKWVVQRCALFCVLNSDGQILTWKLTNSVKFAHCLDVLTQLHSRLEAQHKAVKEFVIDNCCSWRRQLQGVFGCDLIVLLDLFHAVQRVIAKIPKRHKLRPMCVADFRLIFRDPSDRGTTRTKPTPAPGTIIRPSLFVANCFTPSSCFTLTITYVHVNTSVQLLAASIICAWTLPLY